MFPLNSNDQYVNENGKRASLGELFEESEHDIEELETTVAEHTTKISALETLTGTLQDQINPDEYSATESYTAGDYVIHDNVLYKCNTSCAADTWTNNSQYFTATNVTDELAAINSDLSGKVLATVTGDGVANISGLLNTLFQYIPSDVSIGRIALRYGQNEYRCTNASSDGTSYQFAAGFISADGNHYYISTYIVKSTDSLFYRMGDGTISDLSSNIYASGSTMKIVMY